MLNAAEPFASAVLWTLGERDYDRLASGHADEREIGAWVETLRLRNRFCYAIMKADEAAPAAPALTGPSLLSIYHFWDSAEPPADVGETLASWSKLAPPFIIHRFSDRSARDYIEEHYGERQLRAFLACHHPAMRSDYFRLCHALKDGGCYIDADDAYLGAGLPELLQGAAQIYASPLVWDPINSDLVGPASWNLASGPSEEWFYYFNNAPLIAQPGSLAIAHALEAATCKIDQACGGLADIHATTGPTAFVAGLFRHAIMVSAGRAPVQSLQIISNWASIATTKWHAYKGQGRDWRENRPLYFDQAD